MYITELTESERTLQAFYKQLAENPNRIPNVTLYHSDIYYTKALVNEKFDTDYTAGEIYELMGEEGLLRRSHLQPEDKDVKRFRLATGPRDTDDPSGLEEPRDAEGGS